MVLNIKNFLTVGNKGFSLIELLVSVAVIVVIVAVVGVNFRTNSEEDKLQQTASLMMNSLREAQLSAINGKVVEPAPGQKEKPEAYLFSVASDSYFLKYRFEGSDTTIYQEELPNYTLQPSGCEIIFPIFEELPTVANDCTLSQGNNFFILLNNNQENIAGVFINTASGMISDNQEVVKNFYDQL